jgi:glycosyltransferase involved in cell wall biosynthesis
MSHNSIPDNLMKPPVVSVVIPVYNGEKFVRNAMDSILSQTFSDFELIVINDGSTDSSAEVVASYRDPRIVFLENKTNTGLPRVRNQGLDASRGRYIAWLDCDDISLPERLEKQVKFLDTHPQVGVCGGWVKIVGGGRDVIAQYPAHPEYLRACLLFNNCLANSTVMMRAACTRDIGLRFDLSHHLSQDYGLWTRIPREWKIVNLPEVLTVYRTHSSQVTVHRKQQQLDISWEIQREQLLKLGILPTADERTLHLHLSGFAHGLFAEPGKIREAGDYLIKLDRANEKYKTYDRKAFREVLWEKWMSAVRSRALPGKLPPASYWTMLGFGVAKFGLSLRILKKMGWMIANDLRASVA